MVLFLFALSLQRMNDDTDYYEPYKADRTANIANYLIPAISGCVGTAMVFALMLPPPILPH